MPPPGEAVDLFTKPVRKVVAKKAFVSRMLVLVPYTKAIKVITKAESQANHVKVTMTGKNPLTLSHDAILVPFINAKTLVPAWWVTSVRTTEEANMAWAVITDQSLDTVDVCQTKGFAKDFVTKAMIFSIEQKVYIPVLVNTKAIAVGDELTLFTPPSKRASDEPTAAPITATAILKKSKTQSW